MSKNHLWIVLAIILSSTNAADAKGGAPSKNSSKTALVKGLSNRTLVTFPGKFAGLGVCYYSADGQRYCWASGEPKILFSQWRVGDAKTGKCKVRNGKTTCKKGPAMTSICYKYKTRGAIDPASNTDAGFSCQTWQIKTHYATDIAKGDIFGLASGKLPFALPNQKMRIRNLKKMLKKP